MGSVTGIGGANCRHSYWPYIEGVSERTYSDTELEAMKPENRPKIEFEGRKYDDYQATQKQRQIERTVRKLKRRKTAFEAAGQTDDAQAANIRLRRLSKEYSEFSKAAGLPEQRERMKVLYHDGASPGKAAKILEKRSKSGIIETNTPKEMPDVRKPSVPTPLRTENVTEEYQRAATPGQGTVTYEDGYQIKGHHDEIKMADWIHRTFGGDIKLLAESKVQGDKTPDFLWNGRFWELKGVTSKNSIDRAVREAAKQIRAIPGGIILDISASDLSIEEIEAAIGQRIPRIALDSVDALLVAGEQLEKILRYKK